jgi:hypothetical protein
MKTDLESIMKYKDKALYSPLKRGKLDKILMDRKRKNTKPGIVVHVCNPST